MSKIKGKRPKARAVNPPEKLWHDLIRIAGREIRVINDQHTYFLQDAINRYKDNHPEFAKELDNPTELKRTSLFQLAELFQHEQHQEAPKCILCVHDNEEVRNALGIIIENKGHTPIFATSCDEAKSIDEEYDGAIIDYFLDGDFTAHDLLAELFKKNPDLNYGIVTGSERLPVRNSFNSVNPSPQFFITNNTELADLVEWLENLGD